MSNESAALEAAFNAANGDLVGAVANAQQAISSDELARQVPSFGIYIAKLERSGPFDHKVIDQLCTRLCEGSNTPESFAQAHYLAKKPGCDVTVVAIQTYDRVVVDGLLARTEEGLHIA